jgi:hypothetical protein
MRERIPGEPRTDWAQLAAWFLVAGALAVAAVIAFGVLRDGGRNVAVNKWSDQEIAAAPKPVHQQVAEARTPREVLPLIREHMRNAVGPEPDVGAEMFVAWASRWLRWDDMAELEATSFALAQKDPELERGKYVCVQSSISSIKADRAGGYPIYRGEIVLEQGVIEFVAVGSTGKLVRGSAAHFCGVVMGSWEFPNRAGSTTDSVYLVGMFNLPENRPLAKRSASP